MMMIIVVIPRKNPILTHSISNMEKIRKSQPHRDAPPGVWPFFGRWRKVYRFITLKSERQMFCLHFNYFKRLATMQRALDPGG